MKKNKYKNRQGTERTKRKTLTASEFSKNKFSQKKFKKPQNHPFWENDLSW